jgi:NADH-quinone oxidoreductase subunit J
MLLAAAASPVMAGSQPRGRSVVHYTGSTAEAAPASSPTASPGEAIIFYLTAGLVVCSAIGCVLSANIVRMAMWLFGSLAAVAILYFLLSAPFLAAIQLIVYVGGTLVVIIFGVMLTRQSPGMRYAPRRIEFVAGAAVCLALFAGLTAALLRTPWPPAHPAAAGFPTAGLGRELLTTYLVPFELVSVLLLAVMIAAACLARVERKG